MFIAITAYPITADCVNHWSIIQFYVACNYNIYNDFNYIMDRYLVSTSYMETEMTYVNDFVNSFTSVLTASISTIKGMSRQIPSPTIFSALFLLSRTVFPRVTFSLSLSSFEIQPWIPLEHSWFSVSVQGLSRHLAFASSRSIYSWRLHRRSRWPRSSSSLFSSHDMCRRTPAKEDSVFVFVRMESGHWQAWVGNIIAN
jgi:hypothetical protein